MKKVSIFFALTGLVFFGAISTGANASEVSDPKDTRVIITLSNSVISSSKAAIKSQQQSVLAQINQNVTSNYLVEDRFNESLNAIVLDVNSEHIAEIKKIPGVVDVKKDSMMFKKSLDSVNYININLKGPQKAAAMTNNISSETMQVPTGSNQGEGILVAVLDDGFNIQHEAYTDLDSTVTKKVTQESLKTIISGGSTVAKIGSGSNTTYFNSKVPFYYDYGGDTTDFTKYSTGEAISQDWDVASADSHGTHTSSLVGANGPYKGIAPKAQLALMKVFTEYIPSAADVANGATVQTGAFSTALLKGIEDAVKLGADVLSLSLGSDFGDFDGESDVVGALENIKKKGQAIVNFSAGNAGHASLSSSGPYSNYSTEQISNGELGSYSSSDAINSIASTEPDSLFFENALVVNGKTVAYEDNVVNYSTSEKEVTFNPERRLSDLTNGGTINSFDWVKVDGYGEEKDYSGLTVTGKIAVVDRGSTSFTSKVQVATSHGASAVFIINNTNEDNFRMDFDSYQPSVPVCMIRLVDRPTFTSTGSGNLLLLMNQLAGNPNARTVSSFSSDGGTVDFRIKPDVAAPGTSIYGAVNGWTLTDRTQKNDTYDYMSGTSMACPNYSGAMAILLAAHNGSAEELAAYKQKVSMVLASTADQMVSNDTSKTMQSVRRQGAGIVNVKDGLATEQYLEGVDATGAGIGATKIQLFNTEKISNGVVSLSFIGHNDSASDVAYKAKVYVLRPRLVSLDETNYPSFAGKKLQSIEDELLVESNEINVTLAANSATNVTLDDVSLSAEQIKTITDEFANGCPLEGFAVLTPVDTAKVTLSIPYLGYFGNVAKGSPVEPFSFEKKSNVAYGSDLVNYFARDGLNATYAKSKADFGSYWVATKASYTGAINTASIVSNASNILSLGNSIGYNPYTGKVDPDHLIVGNNNATNCMVIQQFVNRSVATNTIFIKDASGNLVDKQVLKDSISKGVQLYRSLVMEDLIVDGTMAHRALSVFLLKNSATSKLYPDGDYTFTFHYELVDGSVFDKDYKVTLDSKAPTFKSVENVTVSNKEYVRVRFDDSYFAYASINGSKYDVVNDVNGYYVDVAKDDFTTNKLYFKAFDLANGSSIGVTHIDDDNQFCVTSSSLLLTHDFTTNVVDVTGGTYAKTKNVTLSINKKGAADATITDFNVSFKLFANWKSTDLEIIDTDSKGATSDVNFTVSSDGVVSFTSAKGVFTVIDKTPLDPGETSSSVSTDTSNSSSTTPDKGNGLSAGGIVGIVAGGIGVVALIAVGVFFLIKSKH